MSATQMTIEVYRRGDEYFAREVPTATTVSHPLMLFAVNQRPNESMDQLRSRACQFLQLLVKEEKKND